MRKAYHAGREAEEQAREQGDAGGDEQQVEVGLDFDFDALKGTAAGHDAQQARR